LFVSYIPGGFLPARGSGAALQALQGWQTLEVCR